MAKQPIYEWDPKTGYATCTLEYKDFVFFGQAKCAPEDQDMMSEKTGLHIAEERAYIEFLQHIKNNEIKPQLEILNHLCSTMNNSKKLNPNSYEYKRILKEIKNLESDLDFYIDYIATEEAVLKSYIDEKDKFYKKVRENRNKDKID